MAEEGTKLARAVSPVSSNSNDSLMNSGQLQTQSQIIDLDDSYHQNDEEDDLDPQNQQNENYNYGNHEFHFRDLNKLVEQHNKPHSVITSEKPPFNGYSSRAEHNAVHHTVWQELRQKAAADDSIPTALFAPLRTYIEVHVAEWPQEDHYCCPCDLPSEGLPVIEIRAPQGSEQGITKDMFLQQVGEALYGQNPLEVYDEKSDRQATAEDQANADSTRSHTIGEEIDRPVVDHFDYMMQSSMEGKCCIMGHIYALTRGVSLMACSFGDEIEAER